MNGIGDFQVAQAVRPEGSDRVGAKGHGGLGEVHRGADDGIPARVDRDTHTLVEQALHVVGTLRVMRSETAVHRGAVDAAVAAAGGGRRQLTVGAREPTLGVVEDVVVGFGARLKNLGVAGQQGEVRVLRAALINNTLPVTFGELRNRQARQPWHPAELLLRELLRPIEVGVGGGGERGGGHRLLSFWMSSF